MLPVWRHKITVWYYQIGNYEKWSWTWSYNRILFIRFSVRLFIIFDVLWEHSVASKRDRSPTQVSRIRRTLQVGDGAKLVFEGK